MFKLLVIRFIMLDSKKDEALKRYLSKVSTSKSKSKSFSSRYYSIEYEGRKGILMRFSDHFSDMPKPGVSIDLVKVSFNYYVMKLNKAGVSFCIDEKSILAYVKSILLVYPEISESMSQLISSSAIARKEYANAAALANKAKNKLKQRNEYIDMVDEIYDQNKSLIEEIKRIKNVLGATEQKLNAATSKNEDYRKKINEMNQHYTKVKSQLDRIKSVLK